MNFGIANKHTQLQKKHDDLRQQFRRWTESATKMMTIQGYGSHDDNPPFPFLINFPPPLSHEFVGNPRAQQERPSYNCPPLKSSSNPWRACSKRKMRPWRLWMFHR